MTDDELRKLDAEVHREVMDKHCELGYCGTRQDYVGYCEYGMHAIPRYSSSIAAAWQVVEKLCAAHLLAQVEERIAEPPWECFFHQRLTLELVGSSTAETAPLAICRAALAAVREQVSRTAR
jgi:hypothetical protein